MKAIFAILFLCDVPFWMQSPSRRFLRLVAFGAYTYAGVLIVLLALENYFLFPTSSAKDWFPPPSSANMQDIELTSSLGDKIHCWYTQPPDWTPEKGAILYSHGNGGNLSGRGGSMVRWRNELKRPVLLYDYPGYGKSSGKPNEASCYASGEAAYRHLVDEVKVPPKEIIFLGSSLGGAMATELATRHECRMLILCCTFTSFPDMAQKSFPWLPARWLVRNKLDTLSKIDKIACPVFLAHGTADTLVPFWMGEKLYEKAREPKRFLAFEGHPHRQPTQPEFFVGVREMLGMTD
jgi:hypothetical protein